jgi:hypothetical protein
MKLYKVKPVLITTNNKTGLFIIEDKLYYSIINKVRENNEGKELILISLEDRNIEIGNIIYSDILDEIEVVKQLPKGNLEFWIDSIYKVIMTQKELSPELIQRLVDEYNNGGMKDFEIEIEDKFSYCKKC